MWFNGITADACTYGERVLDAWIAVKIPNAISSSGEAFNMTVL
jgi:hypothetical protein